MLLSALICTYCFGVGFLRVNFQTYTEAPLALKTYTDQAMTFDARAAKSLLPGEHLTSAEHPGLRLEATASRRTWTYRYRSPVDARLRQIKLGQWPEMSVSAAVVSWEKARAKRDAGEDPAAQIKADRVVRKKVAATEKEAMAHAAYTVSHVCDDYWGGHVRVNRAPKGATEVRRMFDKMLGDLASVPAASVTRAQAFDLLQTWAEKAPVQAAKLRAELGAAWDYGYDSGRLPETAANWWRLVMRGRIKSKGKVVAGARVGTAKRVLTPEEAGTLIRWLPNFTLLLQDVLTLYLWTATRGGEICGMRGSEIKREAGAWWWVIPKARTKNARHDHATDLRVPLFGRALAVVARRKEQYGDGPLFPAKLRNIVRPINQKTIQSSVYAYQPYAKEYRRSLQPRLPVAYWAPHDLRRTARTFLAALKCPDAVGEAIIGHMQPGVKGIYNLHDYDAERVEWLRRLSDYLESLATPGA